jgi:hypothetical protein
MPWRTSASVSNNQRPNPIVFAEIAWPPCGPWPSAAREDARPSPSNSAPPGLHYHRYGQPNYPTLPPSRSPPHLKGGGGAWPATVRRGEPSRPSWTKFFGSSRLQLISGNQSLPSIESPSASPPRSLPASLRHDLNPPTGDGRMVLLHKILKNWSWNFRFM